MKAVAESAMREVVGRSNIQPLLTQARQITEQDVQELIQKTLDTYGAGVQITQVQLLKVDPPGEVIASFRDVQAARADQERIQNEAQTYANKVVPEARGQASQITEAASAYRDRIIAEAQGQADRFDKVYQSYKASPDVTRRRMYLETMEQVLGGMDKVIIDQKGGGTGVVPYLPLDQLKPPRPTAPPTGSAGAGRSGAAVAPSGERPMKRTIFSGLGLAILAVIGFILYLSVFIVDQTQQALVLRFGNPVRVVTAPGLYYKLPLIDNVVYFEKRILDLDSPPLEIIASDQKRLVVDAFGRYKIVNPLLFYQSVGTVDGAATRLSVVLNSAVRRVLGDATFIQLVRDERAALMQKITEQVDREAQGLGVKVLDVKIRSADLPAANSQAIYQRMQTERQRQATEIRAQGEQAARRIRAEADRTATVIVAAANGESSRLQGDGEAQRNRIFAEAFGKDPDFFAFYRSMLAYQTGPQGSNTRLVISPDSEFFRYFNDPNRQGARRRRAGRRAGPAAASGRRPAPALRPPRRRQARLQRRPRRCSQPGAPGSACPANSGAPRPDGSGALQTSVAARSCRFSARFAA